MAKKSLSELEEIKKENSQMRKDIERLREIAYRKEAQIARSSYGDGSKNDMQVLKERIKNMRMVNYTENAISILSWEGIKKNFANLLNSKRIERQILVYGKVCMFEYDYVVSNEDGTSELKSELLVLPFNGIGGTLDEYGEFRIVKPYSPSGDRNRDYPNLVVGVNCVILTDYFQYAQTNCNFSFTIKDAIELYSELIADCEVKKKINRNWISIPFLFDMDENVMKKSEMTALVNDIATIVNSVESYDSAVVTKWGNKIKTIETFTQYYGKELTETIKNYEDDLFNFLGIAHLGNEKKERMFSTEADKNSDQYNINIIQRVQLREKAIEEMKTMSWYSKYFEDDLKIKVNLEGFNEKEDENGLQRNQDFDTKPN